MLFVILLGEEKEKKRKEYIKFRVTGVILFWFQRIPHYYRNHGLKGTKNASQGLIKRINCFKRILSELPSQS